MACLALVAWTAVNAGCIAKVARIGKLLSPGEPETIMESDVGAPPDMESRHSENIELKGETLATGRFTFRGRIEETDSFAQEINERYQERGWKLLRSEIDPTHGRLYYEKDTRLVEVNFKNNPINPSMSQATVMVGPIPAQPAPVGPST